MDSSEPQTQAAWQYELVLALRLREVPGRRIGEVLAEVEAHCADSGEHPVEAFGDPEAYAAGLAPAPALPAARAWLVQAVATPLGVLALLSGTDAVVHGGRPAVTAGGLLSLAVTVALVLTVVARFADVVRLGWRSWLAVSLCFAALTALPAALPAVLTTLPARPVLLAGVLLLAAAWWRPGRPVAEPDEVVDPRTGAPVQPVPAWVLPALRWSFPVVLLAAVVLVALVPA